MSSDFKVGDEVVCVNNKPLLGYYRTFPTDLHRLVVGATYTITHFWTHKATGALGVGVAEATSNHPMNVWLAVRFRKVQKKFTGMETLTALLLNPQKELEHAE